jgi:hypothetical protein
VVHVAAQGGLSVTLRHLILLVGPGNSIYLFIQHLFIQPGQIGKPFHRGEGLKGLHIQKSCPSQEVTRSPL